MIYIDSLVGRRADHVVVIDLWTDEDEPRDRVSPFSLVRMKRTGSRIQPGPSYGLEGERINHR